LLSDEEAQNLRTVTFFTACLHDLRAPHQSQRCESGEGSGG
jgi:hypothetical protein